jgi:hypothetical protein
VSIKLNIGASPIWHKDGWMILDHKASQNNDQYIIGDATNVCLDNNTCDAIFCSHVLEHIPHYKIQKVIFEFSRILKIGGIVRILTPDLYRIAKAYVEKDEDFFNAALKEDENIRTDLGFGGRFMNFIVSPGQDTLLLDRTMSEVIGGYAHIYSYDIEMLTTLLEQAGFDDVKAMPFCRSSLTELEEPLHVKGLPSKWQNLNKEFYARNNLIHEYKNGKYNINFEVTGFDRDPVTSLIVECKKTRNANIQDVVDINGNSAKNYNRYGYSLMYDKHIQDKLKILGVK